MNALSDYTDLKKGIDKDNYFRTQYGPQTIEAGFLSEAKLLTYIAITGAVAIACGLLLVIRTDINTLYLMLAGSFFVLFYTWPLKYIGLGEPSVWLAPRPLTEPADMPAGVWPLYLVASDFSYNKSFSGLLFLAVVLRLFV